MLIDGDWVVENILEHKWMSSEQQSAFDKWAFEEADHFLCPQLTFSSPPPAEDDATH